MKTISLPAPAVAALTSILGSALVSPDRRGTFKRIQRSVDPLVEGNTCKQGDISLDVSDWEWIQALAETTSYSGQIVLIDGDEILKNLIRSGLNGTSGNE